ncbi:MAG: SDR family NAD(P)-dependent oxidoreductase [Planctomycetota bacterium]|nr:SDR family NAD(P)-dependent oxidoreductase [Planctomycetota bacterium]
MPADLAGRPIAITGASSGIGMVTALACARAGMPVALAARRIDRLHEVAETIRKGGGRAIAVPCDVVKPDDCAALVERTVAEFGSIYAIFANAGYGIEGEIERTADDALRDIFEVNFWGTLNTIRPAIPHMRRAGAGHILICSSVVSKMGIPTLGAYSATKAAQDHIGRAMRIELHPTIHVSTVHPIGTNTEFSQVVTARSGNRARTARAPEGFRQPPEAVANAIVRCLRRPRGEVWTSFRGRAIAALATLAPELADWGLRRYFASKASGQ